VRTFGHDDDTDDCTFYAVFYACWNIMPSLAVSCLTNRLWKFDQIRDLAAVGEKDELFEF